MNQALGSAAAIVGRYELTTLSAPGTLGELWAARIASGPEEGRVVRLRRISRAAGLDAWAVDRISNVGFSAMELRHPKVAAMLDVLVLDGEIAVVSEHIDGTLLQTLLRPIDGKRINVPVPVAARIAIDIFEALNEAQGSWAELFPAIENDEERLFASSFHGGLVPDNLLIASFGETMLLEAGLSGAALTVPRYAGHPDCVAYRAPEQLQTASNLADEQADVFTVGGILWELLAGRSLFGPAILPRPATAPTLKAKQASEALQASSAKQKVLTSPIQRLDALPLLRGKVTKGLADFVARCLERDRSLRFASIRDALDALRVAVDVGPQEAVAAFVTSLVKSAVEPIVAPSALESNRPTPTPPDRTRDTPPPETRRGLTGTEGSPRTKQDGAETATALEPPPANVEAAVEELDAAATIESIAPESIAPESLEPSPISVTSEEAFDSDGAPSPMVASSSDATPAVDRELPISVPADHVEALEASPVSVSAPVSASVSDHTTPPAPVAGDEAPSMDRSSSVAFGDRETTEQPLDAARLAASSVVDAPLPQPVASTGAFPPVRRAPSPALSEPEPTSAPVVRPLAFHEVSEIPSSGAADRLARSRKIVLGVVAAAGVLVLIALVRALLGHSGDASSEASTHTVVTPPGEPAATARTGSPSTAAPGEGAGHMPGSPPVNAPSTEAAPTTPAALPTSSPAPIGTEAAAAGAVKKNKKRPFRPSGI